MPPMKTVQGKGGDRGMPYFCISLIVLIALSSCATKSETGLMRLDISAMKSEVAELKQSSAETRKALEMLSKNELLNAVRESQSTLFSQVSELGREVQFLRGKFDENKFFVDRALTQSTTELDLIKAQLARVESETKELSKGLSALDAAVADMQRPKETEAPKAQNGKVPPEEKLPERAEKAYEDAYSLFKEKQFKEARASFEKFMKEFPEHDLAGNALFWLAETYYSEKDFENAILAYEDLIKRYKQSRKVPAALLKQAYAFEAIGDSKAARGILKELIDKYPKALEVELAKEKLKELSEKKPPPPPR